ncbi:hypothetical protein QHH03_07905, partial [Aphanizomenon sp. 202]|nr:hypothetical protein [Aphanizomenon sp. 202]
MLSTELQQEFMINRIEKIVAILMEERPLFKEELNPREMVEHLYSTRLNNLILWVGVKQKLIGVNLSSNPYHISFLVS